MRRFWAFIIMVISLAVMVVFNVQSVYNSNNLTLEYSGGKEAVFTLAQRETGSALNKDDVSDKIMKRLTIAGARDSSVEVLSTDEGKMQVRISLATKTVAEFNNILTVVEGNGPISFSTSTDFVRTGEDFFKDCDNEMSIKYSGVTPEPYFYIGSTTVYEDLVSHAKEAKDETLQKTIYVWQNKTVDDTYDKAFGTDKRADVTAKVIATLSTANYDATNKLITVGTDSAGSAFTIASARAYVNARNADDYGFDIQYLYNNTIPAAYASSSMKNSLIGIGIGMLLLIIGLYAAYGVSGLISALSLSVGTLFQLMLFNFLGFEFTPVTIAAILLTIAIGIFITCNYFQRVKDEMRKGKTIDKANQEGYRKSFVTTLEVSILIFVIALCSFFIGKGMIKSFSGALVIGSLSNFLIVNYLTKWMTYWLTTSSYFKKTGRAFGLSGTKIGIEAKTSDHKFVSIAKTKKHNIWGIVLASAVLLMVLGTYLGYGLTSGFTGFYNSQDDYANTYWVNIDYITDRDIADDKTFIDLEGFENNVCKDAASGLTLPDIKTGTFNRLETLDTDANKTYTSYVSIETYTKLSDANFSALEEYVKGGFGELDMVMRDTPVISSSTAVTGAEVYNSYFFYLTIGIAIVIAMAFYLVLHGLYASIAITAALGIQMGLGFGLLSITRLPVNSLTMFGIFIPIVVSAVSYIPVYAKIREIKRDLNEKRPDPDTRAAAINTAVQSSFMTIGGIYLAEIILIAGLCAYGGVEVMTFGIILAILAVFGYLEQYLFTHYLYLAVASKIQLNSDLTRLKRFKRKPLVVNKNEPHETIIPGIND